MRRWMWFAVPFGVLVGAGVFILAGGVTLFLNGGPGVRGVRGGDFEVAWIHPATGANAWERFVAGARHARLADPGLLVDDSAAFPDTTTAVAELALGREGRPGRVRVRWYKLTSRHRIPDWVERLAARKPAPVVVVGGNNSEAALELARALREVERWHGQPPVLALTAATAKSVSASGIPYLGGFEGGRPDAAASPLLTELYPGRTFRFCFNNDQMVQAVVEFLEQSPDLRPDSLVFHLTWQDDPYSVDLDFQFHEQIGAHARFARLPEQSFHIPYSTGSYDRANVYEESAIRSLLGMMTGPERDPGGRGLLVLPVGSAPARRFLKGLCAGDPMIGTRLVAVTGDSISWNVAYRDRRFAWDVREVPVPLVFFAHQDPVAWEGLADSEADLHPPNSTSDLLVNADIVRELVGAAFEPSPAAGADEMRDRLRDRGLFDPHGDRAAGTGECVVLVRPIINPDAEPGCRVAPEAVFQVFRQTPEGGWECVRRLEPSPDPVWQRECR